jgi:hypothetical protein
LLGSSASAKILTKYVADAGATVTRDVDHAHAIGFFNGDLYYTEGVGIATRRITKVTANGTASTFVAKSSATIKYDFGNYAPNSFLWVDANTLYFTTESKVMKAKKSGVRLYPLCGIAEQVCDVS